MDLGFRVQRHRNQIRTTTPVQSEYEHLIEGMLSWNINQVLQSDISYFLVNNRYYYLVFIIDVYSKRIVGFQTSEHLRASANLKALEQVIRLRGADQFKGLIHHSDRGSQYVAKPYIDRLKSLGAYISMGKEAQQNAYAERINGTIKNEYLNHWQINSFAMLQDKVKKAVYHYNFKRKHDHLPLRRTPVEFEQALKKSELTVPHFELIFSPGNSLKRIKFISLLTDFNPDNGCCCPILDNPFF
jgi:putative transposase